MFLERFLMSKIFGTLGTLELFDFHVPTLDVGLEIVGLWKVNINCCSLTVE